jgi:hypothetical protein
MALTQRISYSQAASATTANVLTGQGVEYIGRASLLDLYGAAFLAAANDQISLTSTLGGKSELLIPSGSGINVNAAGPSMQSDGILNDAPIPAGAHLVLGLVSDATAGTHIGRFMIVITP